MRHKGDVAVIDYTRLISKVTLASLEVPSQTVQAAVHAIESGLLRHRF